MQNKYVGDIGDFGKYGLLRTLTKTKGGIDSPINTLGVLWYLVPDDPGEIGNGNHTQFLNSEKNKNLKLYKKTDEFLYTSLQKIVHQGNRNVRSVAEAGILPPDTVFFDEILDLSEIGNVGIKAKNERLKKRKDWFEKAFDMLSNADMVFLDPDIGLENHIDQRTINKSIKYVFVDEVLPFVERGQSVVIYQHLHFGATPKIQVTERREQLNNGLNGFTEIEAVRYHRGSPRVFFVLPAKNHKDFIYKRLDELCDNTPWSQHFSMVNKVSCKPIF